MRIGVNITGASSGTVKFLFKHAPVGVAKIEEGGAVSIYKIFAAVGGNKPVFVDIQIPLVGVSADGAGKAV